MNRLCDDYRYRCSQEELHSLLEDACWDLVENVLPPSKRGKAIRAMDRIVTDAVQRFLDTAVHENEVPHAR